MKFLTNLIRKIKCARGFHAWKLHSMRYTGRDVTCEHDCEHCDVTKKVTRAWF